MENQEKTEVEVKERKKWMGSDTKIALMAIGLLLISIASAFLIANSDTFVDHESIGGSILGSILGSIWGGIWGSIVGSIWGGIGGGIVGGIGSSILGSIWGGIGGSIVGEKAKISPWVIVSLLIILVLPFSITIVPLSKLHNYQQLERDQKITEILQITVLKDGVKVLLPDQYAGENSYLRKVFSLGWAGEENKKRWKDIVVPYQEGEKYWFYANLPFPENKTETAHLELLLDHAWQDYTTTKEVSGK